MRRHYLHASAVAWKGKALVFTGAPNSGKSRSALRLVKKGALLIADDLIEIITATGMAFVRFPQGSPPSLQGCLFDKQEGLVTLPFCPQAVPLERIISLLPQDQRHCIIWGNE